MHATYVSAREGSFGEVRFGWDAASGCWYFVSPPLICGRAPDGRAYQGEAGKPFAFTSDNGSTALDGRLFAPMRKQMLAADGRGFECQAIAEGGVAISFLSRAGELPASGATPGNPDATTTVTLVVDSQGRLITRRLDSPGQPSIDVQFTYPANQQPGFEAAEVIHDFKLVSYEFDAAGDPDRFDPVSVNSIAMASAMNIQRGLAADARTKTESQQASQTSNPISAYISGHGSYLVPMLGTGLVLVIVGILAARRMKSR